MLGELDLFQIQVYTKRFCKNTQVTKSVKVSIKEGEEEKVEEMRGREKLVRTPQQVFVLSCFCISHRPGRPLRINLMSRYICFSQIGPFDVSFEELFSKAKNPGGFFRKIVF